MKTFSKTIQEPMLFIEHDTDCPSPRENDNVGYFFTKENKYKSPDGNMGEIYDAMVEAESEASNTESHMRAIERIVKENTNQKVMAIFPINRYEHSAVKYSIGTASGFDYSNCGFYIITDKSQEGKTYTENWEKYINAELEEYNAWINGEVYRFILYDDSGVEVEECGGFYNLEDIREYLPGEEWKNENLKDYLV